MTTENKNQFRIYSTIKKTINETSNTNTTDELILEGIAATTSIDLEKDQLTPECVSDLKKQALTRNIHTDHQIGIEDIIGTVISVEDTDDNNLKIKFNILPSYKTMISERIDAGVKLGLSIRGSVEDYTVKQDGGWNVKKINLLEISLTGLPANWDTFGTVQLSKEVAEAKCLSGACQLLRKNSGEESETITKNITKNNEDIMTDKETNEEVNVTKAEDMPITNQEATDLINQALASFKDELVQEYKLDQETKAMPIDEEECEPGEECETEEIETGNVKPEDEILALKQQIADLQSQLEEAKACGGKKKKSLSEDYEEIKAKAIEEASEAIFKSLTENREPESKTEKKVLEETVSKSTKESDDEVSKTMNTRDIAEMLLA
jgi:hypothetical protein